LKEGTQWCFPRGDDKLDEFEGNNKGGRGNVIWSMTRPGGSWSNVQPLAPGGLKSHKRDETVMEVMKEAGQNINRWLLSRSAAKRSTAKSLALSIQLNKAFYNKAISL
jgi:hypothetical protein